MNDIKFRVLVLTCVLCLQPVFSVDEEQKFPRICGWTPMYPQELINGGYVIPPDEYSWLASLHYGNGSTYGDCGGSVINSRYVLTAAHCVEGRQVDRLGGLTGVRLGEFSQEPYCDYGAPNCSSYQFFGIEHIKKHENYEMIKNIASNDIALIRLNRTIQFDNKTQPVCLPHANMTELANDALLIVAGWGKSYLENETAKRAVEVPLVIDPLVCEFRDMTKLCAAVVSGNKTKAKTPCKGDSGGPLMRQFGKRKMVIEGIVSFVQGTCINYFSAPHYTRVRYYLSWIFENVCINQDCPTITSIPEQKSIPTVHDRPSTNTSVVHQIFLGECGYSPMYPNQLISGGNFIQPDEFSWVASLEYRNKSFGVCGGSVISSWFVLTAAQCVTGESVDELGGLTGVRLGDFTQQPYCDYGAANCSAYLHFGIAYIKVHEDYFADGRAILVNDIALLRLDRSVPFDHVMKPVCLPNVNVREPDNNTILTAAGWGEDYTFIHIKPVPAKRAVDIPLVEDIEICELKDDSKICASEYSGNYSNPGKYACPGDAGGPLMQQWQKRKMVIEGIVSFGAGGCGTGMPTHFTRVRHYLSWIEENVCTDVLSNKDCPTSTSKVKPKFPTDCGYTPKHPRQGNKVQPDEYSWLAILRYEYQGPDVKCVGSVINSRYVLTDAHCVTGGWITTYGRLTGVRLGDFNVKRTMCDYGLKECTHYQEFGIEKITPHTEYTASRTRAVNDIALIRLDKEVQFGSMMKPICLPFGGKYIPEPAVESKLTVSGWNNIDDLTEVMTPKREANITIWDFKKCMTVQKEVEETHICAVGTDNNSCYGDSGSPLMYQFASSRMFLEGILSYNSWRRCTHSDYIVVYTRVRSYRDWLDQNMEM